MPHGEWNDDARSRFDSAACGLLSSVGPRRSERPNDAIQVVYLCAVILAISVLILGVGLVRPRVYR
ncbi:MAG: hypothetical protein WBC04_03145 [Candidatus Acidiferrales bacterium]